MGPAASARSMAVRRPRPCGDGQGPAGGVQLPGAGPDRKPNDRRRGRMIQARCEHCGAEYEVEPKLAGKGARCPSCSHTFTVRAPGAGGEPEQEVSESGSPIWRHEARPRDFRLATGDPASIEAISNHIETHLGKVAGVFHELSDLVHVDVHMVGPTQGRPYQYLVTSGMSDLPMAVPEGAEEWRYAELVVKLPPDWPLTQEA